MEGEDLTTMMKISEAFREEESQQSESVASDEQDIQGQATSAFVTPYNASLAPTDNQQSSSRSNRRSAQEEIELPAINTSQEDIEVPLNLEIGNPTKETESKISAKDYNFEAIAASKKLAEFILDKHQKGDHTPTPDLSKHTHIVRQLKQLNPDIKVNINLISDFSDIQDNLLANKNGETALIEFLNDLSEGNEITFNSENSLNKFLEAADEHNVKIDSNKIKKNYSSSPKENKKSPEEVFSNSLARLAQKPSGKETLVSQRRELMESIRKSSKQKNSNQSRNSIG